MIKRHLVKENRIIDSTATFFIANNFTTMFNISTAAAIRANNAIDAAVIFFFKQNGIRL